MTKNKTGNNKFLKKYNQTGILDQIRVHKAVSKAELSQLTGLSPTAIGVIVSSLLEKGYIHETGIGESKGGRRPVLLELKPGSFYSIGIDIDVDCINAVLMDITGEVIHELAEDKVSAVNLEGAAKTVEAIVEEILVRFSIAPDKLLGIGISVPGMVDNETHKIVFAPNLGWENINLKEYLPKLTGYSVYVENEAMASAICENWIGSCQGVNDFVCINIKSGIGAGIFAGGKLYRGAGGSAGEVGHIVVDENGPRCGCGNYGCLETMASTSRIVAKARRLVRQGIVSRLNDVSDMEEIDLELIVEAARTGDEAARSILAESARYLGIALSNIVNTLNPSRIILGKEFVKYADIVMDHIKSIVSCKALKSPAARVEIGASAVGERASMLGAAIIPLKVLFGK